MQINAKTNVTRATTDWTKQQEPEVAHVGIVRTKLCKFALILALFAANDYHRAAKNQGYGGLKDTIVMSGPKVGFNSGLSAVKNLKLK